MKIEVWREMMSGPNGARQFQYVGQRFTWLETLLRMERYDSEFFWAIRKVERPQPGAVQLLLCVAPYNSQEI